MKVCLISSADMGLPYGSTTRPCYIAKFLVEKFGCEILHICTRPPNIKEEKIHYLKKSSNGIRVIDIWNDFFAIYNECKKFSPDVIYPHQPNNAMKVLHLKHLLGVPFIYDAHSSFFLEDNTIWKRIQEKVILKVADKVIVPSIGLKNVFVNRYGISEEKIELVKNGVDTQLLRPVIPATMIKTELGISETDKVVVFTCPRITSFPTNVIALKYLFELIPKIERRIENIKFIVIGGGPQIPPPSHNVIYTGYVQKLESYINIGDVCIAPFPPSAVCGGTRNKVADYFACGKPVISTEEGISGFDDAVPNRDFLLVSDSDDFVDKLLAVLHAKNLSKRLGENARELSLKYDWRCVAKEVLGVLESVMHKNEKKL